MRTLPTLLALALAWSASSASATTMRLLPVDELASSAERIVVGIVETRESVASGTRIYTRHRVSVQQTWRGVPSSSVEVWTMGGRIGDIGQSVAGAARLRPGDRVVLFLAEGRPEMLFLVGMAQGAFHVDPDETLHLRRYGLDGVKLMGPPVQTPSTLPALEGEVKRAR